MIACTVIARNYLAQARVFTRSFLDHHPTGTVYVLVLDDPEQSIGPGEPFTPLAPTDVLPVDEFARMATAYGIVELATAVKPALLRHLLATEPVVAYFDPDIQVFTPLDDVFAAAAEHGIALTPHSTAPLPRHGDGTSTEDVILDAGVFNLGFIAMGDRPDAVDWWDARLRRECVIAPHRARFVDQRWVDLFPAYFAPAILRDPGLNVAWWNAPTRTVTHGPDGPLVNGSPLRFFHFSGYDPRRPWMLSTHQGPIPRVLLSERPDLRDLTEDYRALVMDAGYDDWRVHPYGLAATPGGLTLDPVMRRVYRDALQTAERLGTEEPPNPFAAGDDAFLAWLCTPDRLSMGPWPPSRYVHDVIRHDAGLMARFPDPSRDDAVALDEWARGEGVSSGVVPAELARHLGRPSVVAPPAEFAPGLHVIAPFGDGSDCDVIASRLVAAARTAGIEIATTALPSRDHMATTATAAGPHDVPLRAVNIFVTESARLGEAIHFMPPAVVMAPRNYALVHDNGVPGDVPDACAYFVDALWVCTDEAADAHRRAHPATTVEVVPVPARAVTRPPHAETHRALSVGDPLAAIARHAAAPDGPLLVALPALGHATEHEEHVRAAAQDAGDVEVRQLSAADAIGLLGASAAIIALGDGRDTPIAVLDALASGIPVVSDARLPGAVADEPACGAFLRTVADAALHEAPITPEPRRWSLRRH